MCFVFFFFYIITLPRDAGVLLSSALHLFRNEANPRQLTPPEAILFVYRNSVMFELQVPRTLDNNSNDKNDRRITSKKDFGTNECRNISTRPIANR